MEKVTGTELVALKRAVQRGERLTNAQVVTLAALRRAVNVGRNFVEVHRVALRPGEELMDFSFAVFDAVQQDRVLLADGFLDVGLVGIFEDYVVVRDYNTGRFFKSSLSRVEDGSFTFGTPVEVRSEWVPVAVTGAETEVTRVLPTSSFVDLRREPSSWSFLPPALRSK